MKKVAVIFIWLTLFLNSFCLLALETASKGSLGELWIVDENERHKVSGEDVSKEKYLALFSEAMVFAAKRFLKNAIIPYKEPKLNVVTAEFREEIDPVKLINDNIQYFQSFHEQEILLKYAKKYNKTVRLKNNRIVLLDRVTADQKKDVFKIEFNKAKSAYKEKDLITAKLYFEDLFDSYQNIVPIEMDNVLFWSAESSFGLSFFKEARQKYELLISSYPSSSHYQTAIFRIILMDYILDDTKKFMEDYEVYKDRMTLNAAWEAIDKKNELVYEKRKQVEKSKRNISLKTQRMELVLKNPRLRQSAVEKYTKQLNALLDKMEVINAEILELNAKVNAGVKAVLDSLKEAVSTEELEKNAKVLTMRAILFYQLGRFNEVVKSLDKIPSFLNESSRARYVKALSYIKMGEMVKSAKEFEEIISGEGLSSKSTVDHDLINRARLQLAKMYYDQADKLLEKAEQVSRYDQTRQAIADSIDDIGTREKQVIIQARLIDKKIVDNYIKTQKDRYQQDSLSEQLAKEGALLSEIDEVVQKLAYKSLVSNDTSAKEITSIIDFVLKEAIASKKEIRNISSDLSRVSDMSRKTQLNIVSARRKLRQRIAKAKYELANRAFSLLSEDHPDKPIAKIGSIWSLIKQSRHEEAVINARIFKDEHRDSDKIYQAVLSEAYVIQNRYPSNIEELLQIYRFIWDGEAAYLYVKKLINYRIQILERKFYLGELIQRLSSREDIKRVQLAISKIDEVVDVISFDSKNLTALEQGNLLSNSEKTYLSELMDDLNLMKKEWVEKSERLSNGEFKILEVVNQIILAVLEIGKNDFRPIKYFLVHAPAILQAELNEYESELKRYKRITEKEVQSYEEIISKISVKKPEINREDWKFMYDYLSEGLKEARNKNNAMNSLLKLRRFYVSDGISLFAKEARYGFVSSVYSYIRKLTSMTEKLNEEIESLKGAIERKIKQLNANIEDIDGYIASRTGKGVVIEKTEEINNQEEFDLIISDFGKAFFIGTQHLTVDNQRKVEKKLFP